VLSYDAARQACVSLLAQQGLRPTTSGGHYAIEEVIRAQFGGSLRASSASSEQSIGSAQVIAEAGSRTVAMAAWPLGQTNGVPDRLPGSVRRRGAGARVGPGTGKKAQDIAALFSGIRAQHLLGSVQFTTAEVTVQNRTLPYGGSAMVGL
jgi:hypothetical protein